MAYASWSVAFGEQPSAAKWNILGTNDAYFDSLVGSGTAWTSWVPSWTNLTVSGSTVTAKYNKFGKFVAFRIAVVLGGGNAPTNPVSFSFPVTSVTYAGTAGQQVIGTVRFLDTGVAAYIGQAMWSTTTTASIEVGGAAGTYVNSSALSATIPHAWGNADEIHIEGIIEAA